MRAESIHECNQTDTGMNSGDHFLVRQKRKPSGDHTEDGLGHVTMVWEQTNWRTGAWSHSWKVL